MKVSFLQNNFLQKLSVYTISSYINKAIPFLMLPILTNYLSTDEYGEVSMFLALINLLVAVFGLSIEGALMRKFYDKGESFPAVLFNYLFLLISSFSVCSVLFVIFSSEIATYSGVSVQYLAAAVLSSFFSVACYCVNSLHQVEGKAAAYAIFTNGWSFLNTLLSIILVVFFSLGVAGRVYGIAISTILMGIVGILLLCKNGIILSIDKNLISEELMVFGLPMLPMNLRGTILGFTDKLFIANIIGLSAAGVYTVGNQLAMVIDVFVRSIALAYTPWVYAKLQDESHESLKKIVRLTYTLILVIIIVSFLWIAVARLASTLLISSDYEDAFVYLNWLVACNGILGVQLLLVNFVYYSKKTKLYSLLSTFSIFLNVFLNYAFITTPGAIGAAQATLAVYATTLLFTVLIVYKQYKQIPWFTIFIRHESK